MRLTNAQRSQFDHDGYLVLDQLFTAEEAGLLRREADHLFAASRPEVVREKNGAPRTAFAVQNWSEPYRRLARHPRLIEPAMQLLGSQIYIHQFKINAKAAFDGEVWQWHQDYATWAADDDMPSSRAMNLAVFLDEVNEFNGPLMFIPGSHRDGKLDAVHDTWTTSYPLWTADHQTVARLVEAGGIVAPKGKAGTALLFSGTLMHASAPNLSPWHRNTVYVTANSVENAIRRFQRPDHIAHRDFTPVTPLGDDCLTELIGVPA